MKAINKKLLAVAALAAAVSTLSGCVGEVYPPSTGVSVHTWSRSYYHHYPRGHYGPPADSSTTVIHEYHPSVPASGSGGHYGPPSKPSRSSVHVHPAPGNSNGHYGPPSSSDAGGHYGAASISVNGGGHYGS